MLRRTRVGLRLAVSVLLAVTTGCSSTDPPAIPQDTGKSGIDEGTATNVAEDRAAAMREQMIEKQLKARNISDPRVLDAMAKTPRHRFVPPDMERHAYADRPLPIGHNQTISQPYIVALMTQLAKPKEDAIALDVGTGSGYQAAVLSGLVSKVYSIEIVEPLAESARERLQQLGYENVVVRHGDGYRGWEEQAPFDVIIVAAAPDHVPSALVEQLAPGGKLVIPIGDRNRQSLLVVSKQADGSLRQDTVVPVAFVPMTGEAEAR